MHRTVTNWTLDKLLVPEVSSEIPSIALRGVCLDSRLVSAGDLYIAVGGATTHGIEFAVEAISKGAVAVLVDCSEWKHYPEAMKAIKETSAPVIKVPDLQKHIITIASRFYAEPDRQLTVIAVTGTDGKTTVCRFIAQALSAVHLQCGYIGTLGWGLGGELSETALTTPDAVSLRRMLWTMRDAGAKAVVLEASSHALVEGRLDELDINIAVLTNLGRDHLDYHGTLEAYREAKAKLFHWKSLDAVVLNAGDEFGRYLMRSLSVQTRYVYIDEAHSTLTSSSSQAILHTTERRISANRVIARESGLSFQLNDIDQSFLINTSLIGRFNVDNVLACYATLCACGIAANDAKHGLEHLTPVPGRMERFGVAGQTTVIVDYSHTPQALTAAIAAVRVHCAGELWVIFGCGGDRDPGKRAPMAVAAEAAEHVIVTDDNPRTESSSAIIADILQGFSAPDNVTVIADRAEAIRFAVKSAGSKDLILLAGKGHEDYQIIGKTKYAFSDREQVLLCLKEAS